MRKKQNTRRSIADSVHQIYARRHVRDRRLHRRLRQREGSRSARCHGRADRGGGDSGLHGGPALRAAEHAADAPARPKKAGCIRRPSSHRAAPTSARSGSELRDAAAAQGDPRDYRDILQKVYDPPGFRRPASHLASCSTTRTRRASGHFRRSRGAASRQGAADSQQPSGSAGPIPANPIQCATTNPNSLRTIVTLMAFYLHLGPFSRL